MCDQFIVGATHSFSIGLRDSTNTVIAKANPTIDTANDFFISVNGGAWETLDNAPTVSPAGSEFVDVTFSIAETTAAGVGGYIKLRVADADEASGWIGGAARFNGVVAAPATTADVATITSALTVIDDFLDTEIGAIKAKTDNLPSDPADASDVAAAITAATAPLATATALATVAGYIDTEIGAIKAVTDQLPNGGALTTITNNVAAILADTGTDGVIVASLGTQAKADVNAEVLDVLNVDTFAEPTSAPAATSSLRAKIGWIFKVLRNRMTQTATTQTLYADDGTTADNTSTTSSSSTTFTRGEWS